MILMKCNSNKTSLTPKVLQFKATITHTEFPIYNKQYKEY